MSNGVSEITVDIFDTDVQIVSGDPEVVPLQMGQNPLTISVVDNNKDKYTPIKSKQAKIEIKTEAGIDIMTFTGSRDNRFYVEIYNGDSTFLFKGFLVTADLTQPFLPNRQTLVLTASDCLALLRDVPLTDSDGDTPVGKNRIIKYIAWALEKTGMNLFIKVVNNLRHGSGPVTVALVNFSNPSSTIFFPASTEDKFYPGQEIQVSSAGTNNGNTFVVVQNNGGLNIEVTPAPVHESGATNVTFIDTSSNGHFYTKVYLDAKTFESEIGECENCYQVLEKILGKDCFITQYQGEWWIVRIDEFDENDIYVSVFESDGTFDTNNGATSYNIEIGETEVFRFALADQLLEREMAPGYTKLIYNYNFPLEVPCNKDFSRGDVIDDTLPEKTYALDCWTLREGVPGFYGTVDGTTATIHRIFNDIDYEEERYVVLTARTSFETSSINDATYIESEAIPVSEKDKISASVQFRCDSDIGTGGNGNARLFRIVLNGDDGSWWILGEDSTGDGIPKWFNTSAWTVNTAKGAVSVDFDVDDTEWRTISWDAPAVPISGNIYLWLNQFNQLNSSDDNREVWYSNLSFSYLPYINGSYQQYTGQYQKVTRTETGYLSKKEDEVFISDSPKKLFKGAMFVLVDGAYVLTTWFYPHNVFPSGPPDATYIHPYGELQIRSYFNQYRKANVIFTGTIRGLSNTWPDLINKFLLTDAHAAATNRYFLNTAFNQDWKTGLMQGSILIECYDRIDGKIYSEEREFKYISR